jgi:hypothetical protein
VNADAQSLLGSQFFEHFLSLVNGTRFEAKREFAEVLLMIVSFVSADELAVLMSGPMSDFLFDLLEASPETRVRFFEALSQLRERTGKFGLSEHPFVVRLVEFLDEFYDNPTDIIEV